jgi:DNA polymerase V
MVLTIGYESVKDPRDLADYNGDIGLDRYGRYTPKHAHGTVNLERKTSSTVMLTKAVDGLYERITDPCLMIRRVNVCAAKVVPESEVQNEDRYEQLDLFTDYEAAENDRRIEDERLAREKALQLATLSIKDKYGKNAILKGTNFLEGATTRERNEQVGGHKA